jgi:hypothetical protein
MVQGHDKALSRFRPEVKSRFAFADLGGGAAGGWLGSRAKEIRRGGEHPYALDLFEC